MSFHKPVLTSSIIDDFLLQGFAFAPIPFDYFWTNVVVWKFTISHVCRVIQELVYLFIENIFSNSFYFYILENSIKSTIDRYKKASSDGTNAGSTMEINAQVRKLPIYKL